MLAANPLRERLVEEIRQIPDTKLVTAHDPQSLQQVFAAFPALELAVLVGSRATGKQRPDSDWDFAIQWQRTDQPWGRLGDTETLRHRLAQHLNIPESAIDLIDLPRARLAIRHAVAAEGIPLKGEDSLAWAHFLQRTWRDLEDYDWDTLYAH